ncbi:serine hydrolase FSH [Gymnopilus junonius]|uniref:Serine hydrolase FSH n=1 Tax=Gymnopilus junonius TaxID=109634 RepID=A0A9P5NX88_GYMJU|nr:serine hydrolase FSH [Gymnopilus junonius]
MSAIKRVLVLHGYSQNAAIFSKRLAALRKESKDIDYVFVNAPLILLPTDLFTSPQSLDSEASGSGIVDTQSNPETALRGWWKTQKDKDRANTSGLKESILFLRDVLKEQKFDGVFGFSQGAGLAAVLAALLERPHLYPDFLVDGKSPHPPFQFCVAVSGFKLKDPSCDALFTPSYSTPTLHVLGKTDVVVIEERARQLIAVSANARVEEHEGGHFVPSKGTWRKFLVNWMKDPSAPLPSPSAASVSQSEPPSGTSTPAIGGADYKNAVQMKL